MPEITPPALVAESTLTELIGDPDSEHLDTPIVFAGQGFRRTVTLRELRERATHFAAGLRALGVSPRDKVAAQFPNSEEAVIVQLAVLMLDAVLVPIVPVFGHRELSQIFTDARPTVLVTASRWRSMDYVANLNMLSEELRPPTVVVAGDAAEGTVSWDDVEAAPELEHWAVPDEDSPALLIYTSGSTGVPKGVQHSRRTVLAEAVDLDYRAHQSTDDLYLHTSGAGHIGGYIYVLRILQHGLRVLSIDGWDASVVTPLVHELRPSSTAGMPMHLSMMLDVADRDGLDVSCLELCMVGGAPVPESLIRRAADNGLGVVNVYGLTELPTAAIGSLADSIEVRANSVGRATSRNQIRAADDNDRPVPDGERGELQIRGPELFLGYTNVPDSEVFTADGWFRTGDIGTIDADGLIRIVDRKKNLILRGGENLSGTEIETIVNMHPLVRECAVIGVPDPRYGERAAVFVVAASQERLDLSDLMKHFLSVGASKQKVPEYIEYVDELPRTGTGKLRKHDLKLTAQLRP